MRAAFILLLASQSYAYYVAIDDDQFPALTMSNGKPVDWSTGVIAALLDTSTAVRISARGLHFYDHEIYPLSDPLPCRRAPDCLCVISPDHLAFPEVDPPRYSFGATQCGSSSASRVIVDNPSVYDLSMCDLVTAQADIIWRDGYIYVDAKLQLPDWAYIITALAVLFLVISLGQNIARIMGDEHAVTQPRITEAVCVGLVLLLMAINDPMRVFVALHDRVMAVVTASLSTQRARVPSSSLSPTSTHSTSSPRRSCSSRPGSTAASRHPTPRFSSCSCSHGCFTRSTRAQSTPSSDSPLPQTACS